jgi:transcriptional regulator with XRE-family HTH domain
MNNFGSTLKKMRSDKGFSQEAFAKEIDVHVTNLSKYERNISIPSLEVAKRIALTLETSLDTLVFGDKTIEDDINDNELATLFKKAQLLSGKQKDTVKDFLSAFVLKADLTQKLTK